ncbi:MAG: 50S ribosomal protein L18 [Candidatus Peregrinibacteria bacterium GW2011_GWA2_33_10]|nr:MAG: 50S ribosomal protein L18 [Candidatus Peregrinibacteria bacterium GW2011_GWA2_33_10]KKP39903.1 MAG: 50S ribosomal protein L18, large subunit ribosomal protein L18 [Candidatus Peregrinibacteria bacterium GW2011_GWC2_33_13]OGJ47098.1 MAG: 50S ribosomal protein L18 [Candidatus Peregrinibacteria bacterium RIFOXYA2_FULL_33_7]
MKNQKNIRRKKIHKKIRYKISGTEKQPRLIVCRSLKHIYAQLIDDDSGKVLLSGSDYKIKSGKKSEKAKKVGVEIAEKAKDKKIETCIFDRNGYKYHGRVKELADGAREGGLKF